MGLWGKPGRDGVGKTDKPAGAGAGASSGNPNLLALKKGAKKADEGGHVNPLSPNRPAAPGLTNKDVDELLTPEVCRDVGSLYFDLRYVFTGDPTFNLPPPEKDAIALTMAKAFKAAGAIDPRYVAWGAFAIVYTRAVVKCEATHYQNKKRAQPKKVEAEKTAVAPPPAQISGAPLEAKHG